MQAALVRVELEVHGLALVDLIRTDLAPEDVRVAAHGFVLRRPPEVVAGDHPHAAVLGVHLVYGEPQGADACRPGSPIAPVVRVGMPGRRLAGPGRLRDEMAAPEPDVGSDEWLDEVEDVVAQEELEKSGIAEVDRVEIVLTVPSEVLLEDRPEPRERGGTEDRLLEEDVAEATVLVDLRAAQS